MAAPVAAPVAAPPPAPARRPLALRVLRGVGWVLLGPALLVVLGLAVYWRWSRRALPQVDGEVRLPGLTSPVTVRRDALGVPHLQASSLPDLMRAQGYVTAQDRMWQMDLLRRRAGGPRAGGLRPGALGADPPAPAPRPSAPPPPPPAPR